MSVVLLIVGIVVCASGVVAIGFGIPINEFSQGTLLISGGVTALTGGLLLIGLSAMVGEIARLAETIRGGPAVLPPRRGESLEPTAPAVAAAPLPTPIPVAPPRPAAPAMPPRPRAEFPPRETRSPPHPASPSSVEVSAAAIERLRSAIPRTEAPRAEPHLDVEGAPLSPNGATPPLPRTRAEPPSVEPRITAEDRAPGAAEALKSSRLDFLFRSKPARPAPQPESVEGTWPSEVRPSRPAPAASAQAPTAPEQEKEPTVATTAPETQARPPQPQEPPPVTIVKSGVVDGMAYTLYSDGSIEAKLPHGTVRFGSVAELRAHIESNS